MSRLGGRVWPIVGLSNLYSEQVVTTVRMTSSQHFSRMMRIRRYLGDPGYRNRLNCEPCRKTEEGNQPMTREKFTVGLSKRFEERVGREAGFD